MTKALFPGRLRSMEWTSGMALAASELTPEMIGGAIVAVLASVGGAYKLGGRRNGRNGKYDACPLPLQKAHATTIAMQGVQIEAIQRSLKEINRDMRANRDEVKADIREIRDLVMGLQK